MKDDAFDSLSASRLVLRRFAPRDAEAFAAYRSDPDVARHQAWDSCTLDEARRFVESLAGLAPGTPGAWSSERLYAILCREWGRPEGR